MRWFGSSRIRGVVRKVFFVAIAQQGNLNWRKRQVNQGCDVASIRKFTWGKNRKLLSPWRSVLPSTSNQSVMPNDGHHLFCLQLSSCVVCDPLDIVAKEYKAMLKEVFSWQHIFSPKHKSKNTRVPSLSPTLPRRLEHYSKFAPNMRSYSAWAARRLLPATSISASQANRSSLVITLSWLNIAFR